MKHSWMYQVFFLILYYSSRDKIKESKSQDFSMILMMKKVIKNKHQLKKHNMKIIIIKRIKSKSLSNNHYFLTLAKIFGSTTNLQLLNKKMKMIF